MVTVGPDCKGTEPGSPAEVGAGAEATRLQKRLRLRGPMSPCRAPQDRPLPEAPAHPTLLRGRLCTLGTGRGERLPAPQASGG